LTFLVLLELLLNLPDYSDLGHSLRIIVVVVVCSDYACLSIAVTQ